MKAIVTGGCGFIGYNLVKSLLDNNWNVSVIDDLSSGKSWNRWPEAKYEIAALEKGKLGRSNVPTWIEESVEDIEPDVIFHLAAVPRVTYSVEYPFETTQSNILSTMAVLDAARKHDAKVIYTSSSSIYGGAKVLPTPTCSAACPQSPYAMQKWQGEEWCRLYASLYGLNVVCLRYFNVFGPHSYYGGAYSTVLSAWLYYLYVDDAVCPFLEGDGTQTRDFCHVDNVIQANVLAATSNVQFKGKAFNVAQGAAHSLLECKELLENISGKKLDLEMKPPRIGDVKDTLADITLTSEHLKYAPNADFEKQVEEMAKWYETSYRKD